MIKFISLTNIFKSQIKEHMSHTKEGKLFVVPEHQDKRTKKGIEQFPESKNPPKTTVKGYKLFRVDPKHPGKLFPLFVDADTHIPMGVWLNATVGPKDEKEKDKVKSSLGGLAYRPGWHSGDMPIATHIGDFSDEQIAAKKEIVKKRKAAMDSIGIDPKNMAHKKTINKIKKDIPYPDWTKKPTLRSSDQVWAEVEVGNDVDWQKEALRRAEKTKEGKIKSVTAHITDQLPKGGHYRYKTNSNMTGNWLISGEMKVNRVLTDDEVEKINSDAGTKDLPRLNPFDHEKHGFQKLQKGMTMKLISLNETFQKAMGEGSRGGRGGGSCWSHAKR